MHKWPNSSLSPIAGPGIPADSARRNSLTVGLVHMASNVAIDSGTPVAPSLGATPANARILRLPQVCAITGLGRSMIYQMEAEGRFPHRVPIGIRAVGWVESEVQDWLRRRIESRRTQSAPPV